MQSDDITSVKKIHDKLLYIFRVMILIILIALIIFFIAWLIWPEEGLTVEPFESTEKSLSGEFIADLLRINLVDIKENNEKTVPIQYVNSQHQKIYPMKNFPISDLSLIRSYASSIDTRIAEIGNVPAGGASLSLGQLLLSIKESIGRKKNHVIAGRIQRSGSKAYVTAVLDDPPIAEIVTGEMKDLFPDNDYDVKGNIIEDLAFKISLKLIKSEGKNKISPQIWEAFKGLTLSKKAYARYNATHDVNDLDRSKYWAYKANDSEPGLSEAFILFYNLGYSYLQRNDYENASRLFNNATELNYSDVNSWNGLGMAYFYLNDSDNAIQAYTNANNLDPKNANISYNRALALQKGGRDIDSIEAYDQATKLNPGFEDAWYNKGILQIKIHKYEEAIKALDEAIKLNPEDAEAWNNKGIAFYCLGNETKAIPTKIGFLSESIEAFDKAIELAPGNNDFINNRHRVLENKRNCSVI
ncbi:MAG TPA: tetratricopeptide repeat protein [Methanothrix sp.]|nr:tetratricopeptide repeat protein [Methanothrix sp.]